MTTVGAFEAKTHLSELLDRVAKGERILITNRGKPVAVLIPPGLQEMKDPAATGRAMLEYRERVKRSLDRSTFREMAHEGHQR